MNELEHLRSMSGGKIRRKTELIVPSVTYSGMEGSLNNEAWAFSVPYAFRDALDIKYEERKKNKQSYMVWTQGPLLRFRDGDMLHTKDQTRTVQVDTATPISWEKKKGGMYQGSVAYSEYSPASAPYKKLASYSCTQMQFLALLIYGEYDS